MSFRMLTMTSQPAWATVAYPPIGWIEGAIATLRTQATKSYARPDIRNGTLVDLDGRPSSVSTEPSRAWFQVACDVGGANCAGPHLLAHGVRTH